MHGRLTLCVALRSCLGRQIWNRRGAYCGKPPLFRSPRNWCAEKSRVSEYKQRRKRPKDERSPTRWHKHRDRTGAGAPGRVLRRHLDGGAVVRRLSFQLSDSPRDSANKQRWNRLQDGHNAERWHRRRGWAAAGALGRVLHPPLVAHCRAC